MPILSAFRLKSGFEIDRYFNPPVPFYTLQELMDDQVPVEDIFNGPVLSNGFIKASDLEAAGLKTVLRTSDIINRLMDIEGVLAVNDLLLSKYDAEGNIMKGRRRPGSNRSESELRPRPNPVPGGSCLSVRCTSPGFTITSRVFYSIKTACRFCPAWTKRTTR